MADPKQLEILKQGVDAWYRYVRPDRKIDLFEANLHRANLHRADLRRAKLMGVNLRGADLLGAELRRAKLLGADLRGADLLGAELQGADCRTVINEAGERKFTNLSEIVRLRQRQLEEIDGDRGVIIPEDLTYPEHWPEPPESAAVPEQPEGPFVFISYAHDNKREVAEIARYLRAHEINIWWDDDILPGDPWRE